MKIETFFRARNRWEKETHARPKINES